MSVLQTTQWRANPGRAADFIKLAGEAKKIHERLGVRATLVSWTNAGSNTGTFGYGLLSADFPAWGGFADAAAADAEWTAWSQKNVGTAEPAATLLSQLTAVDQPGFETAAPPTPGSVISLSRSQLAPGRSAEEVLRLAAEYRTIALALGAQSVQVRRVIYGGEASLAFTVATLFESTAALGIWQTKLAADGGGRAFIQAAFGPASPLVGSVQQTGRVISL
jgi:hypothetical protein